MRNLHISVYGSYLIQCLDVRTETAVNTQDGFVNDCGDCKQIEHPTTVLPSINIPVLGETFIVESINFCDLSGFVISSEQCDFVGVTSLEMFPGFNYLGSNNKSFLIVTFKVSNRVSVSKE